MSAKLHPSQHATQALTDQWQRKGCGQQRQLCYCYVRPRRRARGPRKSHQWPRRRDQPERLRAPGRHPRNAPMRCRTSPAPCRARARPAAARRRRCGLRPTDRRARGGCCPATSETAAASARPVRAARRGQGFAHGARNTSSQPCESTGMSRHRRARAATARPHRRAESASWPCDCAAAPGGWPTFAARVAWAPGPSAGRSCTRPSTRSAPCGQAFGPAFRTSRTPSTARLDRDRPGHREAARIAQRNLTKQPRLELGKHGLPAPRIEVEAQVLGRHRRAEHARPSWGGIRTRMRSRTAPGNWCHAWYRASCAPDSPSLQTTSCAGGLHDVQQRHGGRPHTAPASAATPAYGGEHQHQHRRREVHRQGHGHPIPGGAIRPRQLADAAECHRLRPGIVASDDSEQCPVASLSDAALINACPPHSPAPSSRRRTWGSVFTTDDAATCRGTARAARRAGVDRGQRRVGASRISASMLE